MAGGLPQGALHDLGGGNLQIIPLLVNLTPVVDQGVLQHHALGQVEGEAGGFIPEGEQAQLFAQLAVVTLGGLFQHLQVLFQHTGLGEGNAVQTVQAVAAGVGAPVGGGHLGQLHGLQHTGAHQVRAGAQVGEVALSVDAQLPALGGILFHQLQLVILAGKDLAALFHGDGAAHDGLIGLHQLLHLRLNGLEVGSGQRAAHLNIIVPAVLQGGADAELRLGEQVLHGLGHHMGGGVPEGVLAVGVVKREDLQAAILGQRGAQVAHFAVNAGGAGALIQAHANALGNFGRGNARFQLFHVAFQVNFDHIHTLLPGVLPRPLKEKRPIPPV